MDVNIRETWQDDLAKEHPCHPNNCSIKQELADLRKQHKELLGLVGQIIKDAPSIHNYMSVQEARAFIKKAVEEHE